MQVLQVLDRDGGLTLPLPHLDAPLALLWRHIEMHYQVGLLPVDKCMATAVISDSSQSTAVPWIQTLHKGVLMIAPHMMKHSNYVLYGINFDIGSVKCKITVFY